MGKSNNTSNDPGAGWGVRWGGGGAGEGGGWNTPHTLPIHV